MRGEGAGVGNGNLREQWLNAYGGYGFLFQVIKMEIKIVITCYTTL